MKEGEAVQKLAVIDNVCACANEYVDCVSKQSTRSSPDGFVDVFLYTRACRSLWSPWCRISQLLIYTLRKSAREIRSRLAGGQNAWPSALDQFRRVSSTRHCC